MSVTEAGGRWVTWAYGGWQCCGRPSVQVYSALLTHIQCSCGTWIETPKYGPSGAPIVERGMSRN